MASRTYPQREARITFQNSAQSTPRNENHSRTSARTVQNTVLNILKVLSFIPRKYRYF